MIVLISHFRLCTKALVNTLHPTELVVARKIDKISRETKKKMAEVETKNGFVKFFRSSSDATVSVSSLSKVESLNDTEMTNMTNM